MADRQLDRGGLWLDRSCDCLPWMGREKKKKKKGGIKFHFNQKTSNLRRNIPKKKVKHEICPLFLFFFSFYFLIIVFY